MEHRASIFILRLILFWASSLASVHVLLMRCRAFSVERFQVFLGRPLFLFPGGFQSIACLVISSCGFLQVWPIQPHFLFVMQLLIVSCFVLSHSCLLDILLGHQILNIRLKHLLTKTCSLLIMFLFVFHVSQPYNKILLTLVLKILNLCFKLNILDFHIFFIEWKATAHYNSEIIFALILKQIKKLLQIANVCHIYPQNGLRSRY